VKDIHGASIFLKLVITLLWLVDATVSPHTAAIYIIYLTFIIIIIINISGSAAQHGLWPPRSRGFLITYNDMPQLIGLLWTSDQLVTETST
jgi:hypothetical protein